MRFIYLSDMEQFGQKCDTPYYNNITIREFTLGCPKYDQNTTCLNRGHSHRSQSPTKRKDKEAIKNLSTLFVSVI